MLRTDETEFGLLHTRIWPTPTSVQRDHPERVQNLKLAGAETMMSRKAGDNRPNSILDMAMFVGLLPTPTVMDTNQGDLSKVDARRARAKQKNKNGNGFGVTIGELANRGMLPTPRANQVNGCNLNSEALATRNKGNLEEVVVGWVTNGAQHQATGEIFQLSPQFVAEMMGFPTDWTILPFQNGETKA